MKTAKGIWTVILGLAVNLVVNLHSGTAQTTNSDVPDLSVLPLVAPQDVPELGTFYTVQHFDTYAPLPMDTMPGLPVYALPEGYYLIDDRSFNYETNPPPTEEEAMLGVVANSLGYTLEGERLSRSSGSSFSPMYSFSVTSNTLWLEITTVSNGMAFLIIHGTTNDVPYEILTKEDLASANWITETNVLGATNQDWTPVTVALGNRSTNLFFWARTDIDSTGTGIPDWWQLQYFGYVGIDPYADPDGDGWNNLQEYQNGTNPNSANTPPPPIAISVELDPSGANVVFNWASGGGPVQNFIVERNDSGFWNPVQTFPASATSYIGAANFNYYNTNEDGPEFRVEATYTTGGPLYSRELQVEQPGLTPDVSLIRGPGGNLYLAVADMAQNITNIWVSGFNLGASNMVDGIIPLPPALNNLTGATIRFEYASGAVSDVVSVFPLLGDHYFINDVNGLSSTFPDYYNFVDARAHLKENLKFALRSATVNHPFSYGSFYDYTAYTSSDFYYSLPAWDISQSDLTYVDLGANQEMTRWPTVFPYTQEWLVKPEAATNYDYSGYRQYGASGGFSEMQELLPVQQNFFWRNFVWNPGDFTNTVGFATGASYDYQALDVGNVQIVRRFAYPKYFYSGLGTEVPLPVAFSNTNASWLLWGPANATDPNLSGEFGLMLYGVNQWVTTGAGNLFGLSILSGMAHATNLFVAGTPSMHNPSGPYFVQTDVPNLQTVGYYFASQTPYFAFGSTPPPIPGSPDFTITNTSPLLIAGIGQVFSVGGWAKEAILNGDPHKFGYLEQYFDKAFAIDTNGVVTTNQTGVLSPYGEFFPTEPGPVALVTMTNWQENVRGTGIVQVVKLALDANHDGVMDLTYGGPDNTSTNQPYTHWINNNFDRSAYDSADATNYEDDVETQDSDYTPGHETPDYDYRGIAGNRVIPTMRDLQDFARLWICGLSSNVVSTLPTNTTVTLSWGDVNSPDTNNPTIDLFQAADPDGGIGYLTNSTMAAQQINPFTSEYVGRLGPGQSIQLNACFFGNCWQGEHFIWCGVGNGSGALTLTIAQNDTNILAQTMAYIQIVDIKQMYERWTVGDNPSVAPTNVARLAVEDLTPPSIAFQYPENTDTNTPYILYVHGWNMKLWEKDRFAESAFKRLYWQGYQGRFGSFRWSTYFGFTGSLLNLATDRRNYDNSEFNAWRSGLGLAYLLTDLYSEYPGHVYLLAHSMGNVVAGEALRYIGNNLLVNTYVASQGAVPAHVYDSNVTNNILSGPVTPNIYGNWFASNSQAVGKRINFYNINDYALASGRWQLDQQLKPDQSITIFGADYNFEGYPFNNTPRYTPGSVDDSYPWQYFERDNLSGTNYFNLASVADRYEVMSYAAQARSTALGATLGITNLANIDLARSLPNRIWPPDLQNTINPYSEHFYHSAEFRGDYWQQQGYWSELLGTEAFNLK